MRSLVLIGQKGCGKTTLGKVLANQLGLLFIDLDDRVILDYGAWGDSVPAVGTCREIYRHHGREKFRELEKAAIRNLSPCKPSVVATGAGAVLDPDNVQQLRKLGSLVFLRVRAEVLVGRLSKGPVPATLDPADLKTSFLRSYDERQALYESVADFIVESTDRLESDMVAELMILART